jgi:hypothetical protein
MKSLISIAQEEADFTAWIAKNRLRFRFNPRHYTPDYVSWLARINGFDSEMVYRRLSHFDDALALTSIDRRAAQKANWFVSEIMIMRNLDLSEQWFELGNYLMDGYEFEDAA